MDSTSEPQQQYAETPSMVGSLVSARRSSDNGYITVLSDPVNYHVKHPLQSNWTLHQKLGQVEGSSSRAVKQDDWADKLRKSVTIGTVEDFWWYVIAHV